MTSLRNAFSFSAIEARRASKPQQVIRAKYGKIEIEPWEPEPKSALKAKKQVSITTIDRRLQVIRKWHREGLSTAAKAKALTAEVLEAL